MGIVGRETEIKALIDWFDSGSPGGGTLLLTGEPGIGKTALLGAACDRLEEAGAVRLLRAAGVRSESGVPLAGLHQLLKPLLRNAEGLARPYREALLSAFGLSEGSVPDSFLIAVATLELVAKRAEQMTLVIVIDDTHWLDSATTDVLGFVARRLGDEPVRLVISARAGHPAHFLEMGLPTLHLRGLDDESSASLVDSLAPSLDSGMKTRVITAAGGNPLALVELSTAAVSPSTGDLEVPHRLAMTPRLQDTLLDRVRDLDQTTQTLLLVMATDEKASSREAVAASLLLNEKITVDDLAPAVNLGLVVQDNQAIRFCNSLVPAAIYRAASSAKRREVHSALAAVIKSRERQAWHRGASIDGLDEAVASDLETTASVLLTTSDSVRDALAAVELAAHMTPENAPRDDRLLRAAELSLEVGEISRASRLVSAIDPAVCDQLQRARIGLVREMCEPDPAAGLRKVDQLIDAAYLAESAANPGLALSFLESAALSCWWGDPSVEARRRITGLARSSIFGANEPKILSILAICEPHTREALLAYISSHPASELVDPNTASVVGAALHVLGAFDEAAPFLAVAIAGFRAKHCERSLARSLTFRAWNRIYLGDISAAVQAAREATTVGESTRQPEWVAAAQTALSLTAALQGLDATTESLLWRAECVALPLGANGVLSDVQHVRAVVALGNGRYDEALQHLRRTFDPRDPAHHRTRSWWRVGEYAEAALHSGDLLEGRGILSRIEHVGDSNDLPGLRLGLLYARALLSDDDVAEERFQEAFSGDLSRWPLHRARLLLEYGTWLRRRRRIVDARMPLRAAREAFLALGVTSWADRARQELRASRETRVNSPEAWDQLTEQEQQIAELAAQGLSNRQIAQQLYVSHRTVGSHLYRIFPKLGISSRAQLSGAIQSREPAPIAG